MHIYVTTPYICILAHIYIYVCVCVLGCHGTSENIQNIAGYKIVVCTTYIQYLLICIYIFHIMFTVF